MKLEKRTVLVADDFSEIVLQPERAGEGLAYQVLILKPDGTWEIDVR